MKHVVLHRTETGEFGTFGLLSVDDKFGGRAMYTGELPWKNNHAELSAIPAGTYRCTWTHSNRLGRFTYQVMNVPDRSGIRIHPANLMGDVEKGHKAEVLGCIAIGYGRGDVHGQPGVVSSRDAVTNFEDEMGGEEFDLTIVDEFAETGEASQAPVA